jgi:hypothetical protein
MDTGFVEQKLRTQNIFFGGVTILLLCEQFHC